MNYFNLKFLTFFLTALLAFGVGWADEVVAYTLTPKSGTNNSYTGNCDIDIDGITWNLTGNSQQLPWRIGGKSIFNVDRTLYSKTSISENVSKIEVKHGAASSITVNSWTVIVSKNSDFSNPVSSLTPTFSANSTTTITRPDGADWSNCYFKFVYKVTVSGTSNKFLEFSEAKFYDLSGGSVTPTCAKPTFSLAEGSYYGTQSVSLSCETEDATIYYTTDGSDPDENSDVYGSAINVDKTMTIKAIAMKGGMEPSSIASAEYIIKDPSEAKLYTNVTDLSQLKVGYKYILVNEQKKAFCGAIGKDGNNYGLAVTGPNIETTTDGKKVVDISNTEGILEMTLGGDSNGWTFDTGNGYLNYDGKGNNSLHISNDATIDGSKWTAADTEFGFVSLQNVDKTDRYIRFNSSSPRFACYTSAQSNAILYVEVKEETPTDDPTIEVDPTQLTINDKDEKNTFTVTGSNLIDNIGVTPSEGFSTDVEYIENNNGSAEGTVKVTYTGLDLYAEGTVEMGTDKDATGEDITKTVSITYQPDIYLYGDLSDNNHDDWGDIADGKMERNGDFYSKTITLNEKGFLLFARKTGETYGWDKNRLFFGPVTDGQNWQYVNDATDDLDLNPQTQYHPLELPAGIYTITINAVYNTFSISREELPTPIGEACPAVIEFADNTNESGDPADSTTAFSGLDIFLESVSSGQGFIQGVTIDKVYAGKHGIKFGTSKNGGNLTIDLKSLNGNGSWRTTKVIVNAMQYEKSAGVYEQSNIIVNNTSIALTNELTDHEFVFDGSEISSLKVSSTARMYVKSITIMHECGDEPVIPELAVSLPEVPAEHYKVGQEVKVKATVENGSENTLLTYKVGEETLTPDNEGNVTLPNKKAGDVVVTVKATDGDRTANDSKTYVFDAAEALTITLNPANGEYYVGAEAKVNVTVDKAITTNPTITYKFGEEGEAQTYNAENGIVLPTAEAGTINLTVTVDDNGYEHTGANTATGTYTVKAKEPAGLKFVIQKVEGQQDNIYQYFSIGKDPVKPTLENPNDLPVNYSVLSPEGIISIDAETGEVTLLGKSGTGSIVAETTGDETHAGGKVYLSFNVRPEVATYKLVTDASKLKADDKFIIVGTNQSGTFGMDMLSYGSDSNPVLGSQKVVIADNKIETNLPEVFTLKAVGSESANWYMQENTYRSQSLTYLTARGDNGLYFQNPGQNSEMSISIASDGKATIQFPNVDAESAKYLRMTNYTNARFGRYETTDGSVPIYIYKQVIQEEPTLAFAEETPAKAYVGDELTLTVNNVPEGATLTFTSNPADAVEFDDNGKVTFLKAGEVKITANTTETDEFLPGTVTYTITVENKPVVETDLEGNNLDLVAVVGESETGKIIVSGENLKGDITLTLNDTKGVFAIDVTSIAKEDAIGEVTVTYTPKAATSEDFDKATVTIKSTDAETVTVNLTGKATLPTPEIIAEPENLTMTAVVGQTPATATFTVMASDLRGDITLTMSESDVFTIEPATIRKADMTEDGVEVTVTYKPTQAGNDNAAITIASEAAESITVTLAGTATVPEVVAMPTFSLVAGSYTGPQTVIINCATEDATISYSTDGGQTWTKGNTVNVDKDMTIMAKAEKDGMTVSTTASATYVIITEETPETVNIETGYYQIKNLGNGLYANVAGRKTLNFTDAPADKAGTVIYVDVENDGTVKSLRSQAADLQRYADRAMSYVPEVVKIVAQKLNADGSGEILGETGLEKILEKFNKCFDHNLHVEQAEGGYRLYGKTPSMQPVVEFYRENKDKVEAKLPNLEAFINSALEKLKAKIGGSSVFTEFKLHDIWDKMGGTLTEPVDAASTMAFYREVLNNKNYVWDFAYQTAMIYVNNLMSHPRWPEVEDKLGEYAQYIDKIKQIRPEFKYYIVQKDGKPDFISEGNKDIIDNNPRTIWTLEPRTDFTVNFPEANKHNGEYVTTLYTDFAYTLPKGVTAYTVTEVSTQGVATLTALEGTIPAQTPVLLKSTAAGPQTVTLSTEAGTAPADNLLVGPDYLIKHYEFKTPQVVDIFNFIKDKLPGFYDEYVAQYEYLMLKTAGTVGNKYFWDVNSDLAGLKDDCIVRSLAVDENGTLAFSDHWTTETNKAFLVDDANNPQGVIKLPSLRGDINKDGVISIIDVTALIDILLDLPARTYLNPTDTYPKGLDYVAADVNENNDIEITDVTTLIDILLNMPDQPAQGSGN